MSNSIDLLAAYKEFVVGREMTQILWRSRRALTMVALNCTAIFIGNYQRRRCHAYLFLCPKCNKCSYRKINDDGGKTSKASINNNHYLLIPGSACTVEQANVG